MQMKRDRSRKFRLRDGTTVEYRKEGDIQSRTVTSPSGTICHDEALTRIVWPDMLTSNLYASLADDDLAPPNATMTDRNNPRRCWNCGYYSFKVYGGEDDTEGKCFRDRGTSKTFWWVNGLMTCPSFILGPISE